MLSYKQERNHDKVQRIKTIIRKRTSDKPQKLRIHKWRDISMKALRELFKDELEEAYKEGENRINLLYARLKKDGREQDILRAIEDPELCQKFFKEYGMK